MSRRETRDGREKRTREDVSELRDEWKEGRKEGRKEGVFMKMDRCSAHISNLSGLSFSMKL